ncbi:hypothetical protein LCGC14_2263910, partial [marine sediment metagenome]
MDINMKKEKKNKNLDRVLSQLEKNYAVQKGSDIIIEPKIRTGIYPLDYVFDGGISQIVGGHIIEFFGGESSGKTTFAKLVIKKYQELGKVCAFINAENSYDPNWASVLGVDNEKIIIVKPTNLTLEQTGDLIIDLIGKVDLIVVDSISAIVAEEELGTSLSDKAYAPQAKVNSPMCRKINERRSRSNTTIIFINQLREKVGQRYGNPETTSGGRALKHLYDTRIRFRPGKPITHGSGEKLETIGFIIQLWAKKNKKGKPLRKAEINFYLDGTLENQICLFFSAIKYGVIQLSGKTYTYKDKKVVGKDNLLNVLI